MNREYLIRGYEAGITILSSYLSISSFFKSSLYNTIASGMDQILRMMNIRTISSQQVSVYIPILVTAIVALVIIYDYFMGTPEDIIDIYQINLLLITPEVLSFSKLDWLNLIQRPQILDPTRNPLTIFVTGSIVFLGYLSLYFISKSREDVEDLRYRGVDETQLEIVFEKQSTIGTVLALFSVILSVTVFLLSTPVNNLIRGLVTGVSYGYLVFGVPGILLLLVSLWLFLKIEEKKI